MSTTSTSAQVPKLRFPGFEGEWPRQQLDAITSKKISYGIVQAGEHVPGGMPYIKSQDLNQPLALDSLQRTSDEIAKRYRRSEVEPGDIVFSLRGNIGVCQIVPASIQQANLTQGTARIAVAEHDNRLVAQTLHTLDVVRQIEACAKGSTFREISLEALRKINVALAPTLPEQQKVAAFLTAVDGRIEQLSRKKALLEEYKKGVMQQLFTQTLRFQDDHGHDFPDWEEKRFYDLLDAVLDFRGRTPLKLGMEWGGGSIISLSANNVKNGRIDLSAECNLASDALYERWMGDVDLQKGDIVFTMEAPLGQALLIPDNQKYILSQRVVAFKTKRSVHNPFLLQLIWSEGFQSQLSTLATGSTAKGINQKSLQKVIVQLPSLPEQTKIAGFLSALDGKIGAVGEQMRQTQAWKKGLLQQMFV